MKNELKDKLKENLAIESLNEDSPPPELKGPQCLEHNTNCSDYTQLHHSEYANMVITKALAVNALNELIIYKDAITCADTFK